MNDEQYARPLIRAGAPGNPPGEEESRETRETCSRGRTRRRGRWSSGTDGSRQRGRRRRARGESERKEQGGARERERGEEGEEEGMR